MSRRHGGRPAYGFSMGQQGGFRGPSPGRVVYTNRKVKRVKEQSLNDFAKAVDRAAKTSVKKPLVLSGNTIQKPSESAQLKISSDLKTEEPFPNADKKLDELRCFQYRLSIQCLTCKREDEFSIDDFINRHPTHAQKAFRELRFFCKECNSRLYRTELKRNGSVILSDESRSGPVL